MEIILKKADEFTQLVKGNRFLANQELNDERYLLLGESPSMVKLRETIIA